MGKIWICHMSCCLPQIWTKWEDAFCLSPAEKQHWWPQGIDQQRCGKHRSAKSSLSNNREILGRDNFLFYRAGIAVAGQKRVSSFLEESQNAFSIRRRLSRECVCALCAGVLSFQGTHLKIVMWKYSFDTSMHSHVISVSVALALLWLELSCHAGRLHRVRMLFLPMTKAQGLLRTWTNSASY